MKKVLKRVSGLLAFAVFVLVITALVKTHAASAACNHDWAPATCSAPKTCKKYGCHVTEGSALGHNYAAATCSSPKKCTRCGTTSGSALGHNYADATCTTPKKCTRCGGTSGSALGHSYGAATCTSPKKCSRCGGTSGSALGHDYAAATCSAPKTCKRYGCHATSGSKLGHNYADATCTAPKTCTRCKTTSGSKLGHNYADATCTAPKTCTRCNGTSGDALGHSYAAATCTSPATCNRCKTTSGNVLGHDYAPATCSAPKTCKRYGCHATSGSKLGHNYSEATCTVPATCSRCNTTSGNPLGHDYGEATCTAPATCSRCKTTSGDSLGHSYGAATCTAPATCSRCKATSGDVLGHDYAAATCSAPKTCKRYGCHATSGDALGHNYAEATCTAPKTCSRCKTTSGDALGHNYADATCTVPATCSRCKTTSGDALGHNYDDATCFAPATCTRTGCHATTGSPAGHNYTDATCTKDRECKKCGYVDKGSVLGHSEGAAATCTSPQTCTRSGCGAVIKDALGHNEGTAATCTSPQECTRCNTVLKDALGHKYDDATCFAPKTCTRTGCHETKGEPLGHSYKAGSTKCERCGYEKQEAKIVKVSFDVNGGLGGQYITGITAKFGEKYGSLPAGPSPMTGYRFIGWYTAKTGGTRVTSDTTVEFNYDHTLYAHYEENKYTIAFNGNGSTSGSMSNISARYDTGVTLPANAFVRKNYTFIGWSTSKDGTGVKYADKATVKNLAATDGSKVTLYAQWKSENEYLILFDDNGGDGGPGSQTGHTGSSVKLSTIKPTRENCTFKGWSWAASDQEAAYQPGAQFPRDTDPYISISNKENVTLYAIWEEAVYTVNFYPNGAPNETVKTKKTFYNETVTAPKFEYLYYEFAGWSRSAGNYGKIDYAPGEKIVVTTSMNLYARWTPITYKLSFNLNGGESSVQFNDRIVNAGGTIQLSTVKPEKEGYIFKGWSLDMNDVYPPYGAGAQFPNKEDADSINHYVVSNKREIKLYAIWAQEAYAVKFYPNGATGENEETVHAFYEQEITAPKFKYQYHEFAGWSRSAGNYGKIDYAPGKKIVVTENMNLYARWTPITYTVSFNLNGGEPSTKFGDRVVNAGNSIRLSTEKPEKAGYTFKGWSWEASDMEAAYQPGAQFPRDTDPYISISNEKNVTLYAIWEETVWHVTFVYNDGTDGKKSEDIPLNESVSGPLLTRDGYVFLGWSKSKNSTKATYEPAQDIMVTEDMTLYGVWAKIKEYTLTFDYNDGSGETKDKVVEDGTQVQAPWPPTREGYVFMGWSRSSGVNARVEYNAYEWIKVTRNMTLYAIWKKEVTITFVYNDEKNSTETLSTYVGGKVTMPGPKYVKDGYSLLGWSESDKENAPVDYKIGKVVDVSKDITLYAQWVQKRVINYDLNGGTSKVPIKEQVIEFNEQIDITTVEPERRFHKFLGWSMDQYAIAPTYSYVPPYEGNTKIPDENDVYYEQYKDRGNITLYAVWQKIVDDEMIINLQKKYGEHKLPDNIFLTEGISEEWIKLSTGAYGIVKTTKEEYNGATFYFSNVYVIEKDVDRIKFNVYGSEVGLTTLIELHTLESHSDALGLTLVTVGRILNEATEYAGKTAIKVIFPAGNVYLFGKSFWSVLQDTATLIKNVIDASEDFSKIPFEGGKIIISGISVSETAYKLFYETIKKSGFWSIFEQTTDPFEKILTTGNVATVAKLLIDVVDFWTTAGRNCYENVDQYGGNDEVTGYYIEVLEDDGFGQSVTSEVGSILTNLYNTVVVSVESIEDYTVMAIDEAKKARGYIGTALNSFMKIFK